MSVQLELDTQILSSSASSIDILLESQTLSGSSSVELVLEPSVITVTLDSTGSLGAVIPLDGTTGQVLAKQTNANYDTYWRSLSAVSTSGAYADLTGRPTLPSGVIIGDSDTQTLTNKTVTDASFTIQDDLDNTKKASFQCASLVTGTTYTYTFPAVSGIFILDVGTQNMSGSKIFSNATLGFGSSVATSNYNIAYGANASGVTKTVNIGTAGLSGSTTNITIGSAVSGALGQILLQAPNIFAFGTLTYRGTLAMQSTSIAGNPIIWSVQDQTGAVVTEYGRSDGVASAALWDFHTGAVATDFDSRVNASGGTGTTGGGNLQFIASSVYLAGSSNANTSLQVTTVTSAVNSVKVSGAITGASPVIAVQGTDTNIDLSLSPKGTGSVILNGPIQVKNYTVATLPTAGTAGRRAYVTDATSPTWLGTLTGGGAVKCPVFDNGTAWVAG
jgi:hypothetical protein